MSADSLAGLLADAGIKPKRQDPGHTEKLVCPRCSGGKTREVSLSVAIDADGRGATWQCWRGQCGWKSGARVHEAVGGRGQGRAAARLIQRPVEHTQQQRSDAMYTFFAARGIQPETVDAFGIYEVQRRFPTHGEQPAIVFPYIHGGELVNRKYRPPQKTPQLQDPDALPTLFNVDRIETPDVVW